MSSDQRKLLWPGWRQRSLISTGWLAWHSNADKAYSVRCEQRCYENLEILNLCFILYIEHRLLKRSGGLIKPQNAAQAESLGLRNMWILLTTKVSIKKLSSHSTMKFSAARHLQVHRMKMVYSCIAYKFQVTVQPETYHMIKLLSPLRPTVKPIDMLWFFQNHQVCILCNGFDGVTHRKDAKEQLVISPAVEGNPAGWCQAYRKGPGVEFLVRPVGLSCQAWMLTD